MIRFLAAIIRAALVVASFCKQFLFRDRPNAHHLRMQRQASRALHHLRPFAYSKPGSIINYVRKMHPHAVEELVLSAAEAAGHKIRRNQKYVGDGGFDGMICLDEQWHLVQTKRYSSAINPQHVRDFGQLCLRHNMPGLFVHFGRTGPQAKLACNHMIRIISGPSVLSLIAGRQLSASPTGSSAMKAA